MEGERGNDRGRVSDREGGRGSDGGRWIMREIMRER